MILPGQSIMSHDEYSTLVLLQRKNNFFFIFGAVKCLHMRDCLWQQ